MVEVTIKHYKNASSLEVELVGSWLQLLQVQKILQITIHLRRVLSSLNM